MLLEEVVLEENFIIEKSIQESVCWQGKITGLEAEDLLRGNAAYTYLLRTGEKPQNYYISFVEPSGLIKHQPIEIRYFADAWFSRNYLVGGPYKHETIEQIIHKMMHCAPGQCLPLSA